MNESRASEREFGFLRFRGIQPETPPLVENRGWNWSLTTSSDARQWGLPNPVAKLRENQSETFCVSSLGPLPPGNKEVAQVDNGETGFVWCQKEIFD